MVADGPPARAPATEPFTFCIMAEQTRLTDSEVLRLLASYPKLPSAYLGFLRNQGWGTAASGHMIYSNPISPTEVYPQLGEEGRVLIGDDMQGFCLGYDFKTATFGEYSDSGEWSEFGSDFDLARHLSDNGA